MRISCSFQTERIPLDYRMAIVSVIKEALRTSDQEYYQRLYQKGLSTKPFVFSVFLRDFHILNDEIKLDGLTLIISSPDYEFLLNIYNGLQKNKVFSYKDYEFVRRKITMIKEKKVTGSTVVFRTLSPILVEDEGRLPIAPDDPNYEKHINYLANVILSEYRGTGLHTPLFVRPLQFKKVVVKESNHEFKKKYGDEHYLYFTAYRGLFELTGHPADLQLLYQLGLSKRRNQGFGQLEIEEVKG